MLNGKYQLDRIAEFFEFIYDRQEIWHRRNVLNLPAPWSTDEILRNYRFCNVYRELDGGTLALTKYLTDESISVGKSCLTLSHTAFLTVAIRLKTCSAVCWILRILILRLLKRVLMPKEIRRACFQTPI